MIIIAGVSLREQHTDLLICHLRKQDLSHTSRYLGITYDKPTARTPTVSVSTDARTKLYNKVISCISDVISTPRLSSIFVPHLRNIKIETRSFKIFGIWPQTDIHTHMRNTVTLVWGSLRLAPKTIT